MTLERRILRLVGDVIGVPEERLTAKSSRADYSTWDSVGMVHLLTALESEFEVTLSIDDVVELSSIERIHALLVAKGLA